MLALVLMTALLPAQAAMAKKGGGGPNAPAGTLTLNQSNPYLGEWVTFTYSAPRNSPRIRLICYQNGAMVFAADQDASTAFLLGGAGSTWTANGGSADCQADLYSNTNGSNFTVYASLLFTAAGAQ